MNERKVKMPKLQLRATFKPESIDQEKRTVEVVWTTGQRVLRKPFWSDPYYEELSLNPSHLRMDFLNSGLAPCLNSHSSYELRDVIGVVEKAWLEGSEGRAIIRFSEREEVNSIWQDVKSGILRGISVGYFVHKFERQPMPEGEEVPTYLAVDWEPKEISLVAIGADSGAKVRASEDEGEECVFVNNNASVAGEEVRQVEKKDQAGVAPDTEQVRKEAAAAERKRTSEIVELCRKAKLGDEVAQKMIDDGVSIDDARKAAIDELAKRDQESATRSHVTVTSGGQDEVETRREGVAEALLHRADPSKNKLGEKGRDYRGMSLLEIARELVAARGVRVKGLSKMEIAERGLHSTSDFPYILANVANKSLRAAYESAPQTFRPIVRQTFASDFKQIQRTQLGDAPQLVKVLEGGEITKGTVGESKEVYSLATYARQVAITRQTIINDDMDAFTRLPMMFGRSAADLESDLVWGVITANASMNDSIALFHASHGNLAASGSAISVTSLGAARAAMRVQKGLGGKNVLNVQGKYLVVPAALETIAEQYCSKDFVSAKSSDINPFKGTLSPIAEPRLDATSALNWYLFADPNQIDVLELAYLDGQSGVYLETAMDFNTDGVATKARLDVAAKAIDWRGMYKNPGA
jgi:phage major head subunit gpT-like protein